MPLYEFEGKKPVIHSEAFVHPLASAIGDVQVGPGCYVGAGAVLRGDIGSIRIGQGSNVQENCVLHSFPNRAVILHPNSHVGHGSILHGCEIFSNVLIGMGSIIADGVKVNSYSLVGSGSFIPRNTEIPPRSLVMGSPARVIKPVTEKQLDAIANGLTVYQELARRYLKAFKEIPFTKSP